MIAADLYHTGLVVEDLDEARSRLTELAGYRWGPTAGGDTPVITADGERVLPMRIVYSADEPRIELVQAMPGTIWMPTGAGVHHLGYWSDDVDADMASLVDRGLTVEARAPSPEGSTLWAYCNGGGDTGPRIELVSRAIQPVLQGLFVPQDE